MLYILTYQIILIRIIHFIAVKWNNYEIWIYVQKFTPISWKLTLAPAGVWANLEPAGGVISAPLEISRTTQRIEKR